MKLRMLFAVLTAALLLSGCGSWEKAYNQASDETFKVVSTQGPGALGLLKAMEPSISPQVRLGDTVQYAFEGDENELYTRLSGGEADIAVVPTEMAAKLYNSGAGYQIAAVNTGGYLYLVSSGKPVASISELKGKVVKIAGENTASDIVFRYLIAEEGMAPGKDLTLEYASSAGELEDEAASGKADFVVLPEPYVSELLSKNSDFGIALDLQDEWAKAAGEGAALPQTCLIVKKEAAAQKQESWNLFVEDYKDSVKWVNSSPDKAAELLDKHDLGIAKEIAGQVILRSNLVYLDGTEAKAAVEKYLNVYLEMYPEKIGGKVPDSDFFYGSK